VANSLSAEAEIRRRIREKGAITFAEFMEVALFWPQGGYYLGPERIGPSGDYYTSPMAHPAFGALLAAQLYQMWQLLGYPVPFTVVELGAGNGALCRDLAAYTGHLGADFARALRYICLERRAAAGIERDLHSDVGAPHVNRLAAAGVPLRGIRGCFLSNEFLDSFPVHRVTLCQGKLREVYVTLRGEELAETLGEPSTPALLARLEGLGTELAEGQAAEINLGLDGWAEEVAAALEAGFVLTIDYGRPAAELYSSTRRPRGTLTTFYRHVQTDAPLRRIGRQDITAQVDFTSVASAGRRVGLEMLGYTSQREFLRNLGLGEWQRHLTSLDLPPRETQANRTGMLDLARPGGLGDFKVLAQGKGVGQPKLWGFEISPEAAGLAESLSVPLLTGHHLRLLEGRYPNAGLELELEHWWPFGDEAADTTGKG
jgi:SAM-dependent MidA family methyltransferase